MLKAVLVFYFCQISLLFASDNKENIKFKDIEYPISHTISVDEKTYILFETPISQEIDENFNRVFMHGKVNDPNIKFELWAKLDEEVEKESKNNVEKVKYEIYPGILKIYPNGRFWARFDLNRKINNFKLVVINMGVKVENFNIKIYEIKIDNISKKKQEESLKEDKSLSLAEPLPFKLIRREEWKANKPTDTYTKHLPIKITIHNTAAHYPTTIEDSFSEVQFIQDYHQNAKGWIDIGYHFLIDPLGNIFEGRPVLVVGAHVKGENTNNIGISIMGNYHPTVNDKLTDETIKSIIILAKHLKTIYSINKKEFYGHRDLGTTDCPGDIIYSRLEELRKKIFDEKDEEIPIEINIDTENQELKDSIKKVINNW